MAFGYNQGVLSCSGLPIDTLTPQYGSPLYVYAASILNRNAQVIRDAFVKRGFQVSYAMKANPNPAILRLFKEYGFGMDIVSGGELKMALETGFAPEHINFAGVGKTEAEMRLALETGIGYFNVESLFELEKLNALAHDMGVVAKVLLRINPDIDPKTHPHISTGLKNNKFGMSPEQVRSVFENHQTYSAVSLLGLHAHIGSQILEPSPFETLIKYLKSFADTLREKGHPIQHLDLGGGFGVNYENPFEDILMTTPYLDRIAQLAADTLRDYQLHIQPGRVLVANSALLVGTVLGEKRNGDHRFIVSDAATTELIRPALYSAHHAVFPVGKETQGETADLVGPVCESSDALAKQRQLPEMAVGDLVAVGSAGAYASSMASTYNLRPLAAEVMVSESGEVTLIRRRQSFEEMISLYL